jgi:dTDP-glucose 4,6-dehydratase
MKLLLTGGAGFLGHHVVESILKNTDWDIVILDRLDTSGNLERLTDIDIW